jgi:hypothetical protein
MTDHLWSLLMCLTSPDPCSIFENAAFKCILTAIGPTQTCGDGQKYKLFWGLNISNIVALIEQKKQSVKISIGPK